MVLKKSSRSSNWPFEIFCNLFKDQILCQPNYFSELSQINIETLVLPNQRHRQISEKKSGKNRHFKALFGKC